MRTRDYCERRDVLYAALIEAGFHCSPPKGAYYILADFSELSDEPDDVFARRLTRGVEGVPGVPIGQLVAVLGR